MRRLFSLYEWLAPAILAPFGAWLWWRHYEGNAALALMVPIVHGAAEGERLT